MRQAGLRGVTRGRRKIRTTETGAGTDYPVDLVERDFTASAPDRLWVADLTYIRTRAGWVYAAFIIDAYSKYIVIMGEIWQTATTLAAASLGDLAPACRPGGRSTLPAQLEMALATRRRRNHERLVHHSPFSRNQREPTAGDTPAATPAFSLDNPPAIPSQNRSRCSRRPTGGRPGDRIAGRNARSARRTFLASIVTPHSRNVATTV